MVFGKWRVVMRWRCCRGTSHCLSCDKIVGFRYLDNLAAPFDDEAFLVLRKAPFRYYAVAARHDASHPLYSKQYMGRPDGMADSEIIDALFGLFNQ